MRAYYWTWKREWNAIFVVASMRFRLFIHRYARFPSVTQCLRSLQPDLRIMCNKCLDWRALELYLLCHCNRSHSNPPVKFHRLKCSPAHDEWFLRLGSVRLATVWWSTGFFAHSFWDFHVIFGRWSSWLHNLCWNETEIKEFVSVRCITWQLLCS